MSADRAAHIDLGPDQIELEQRDSPTVGGTPQRLGRAWIELPGLRQPLAFRREERKAAVVEPSNGIAPFVHERVVERAQREHVLED